MMDFTPLQSFEGGLLIGAAAALLMVFYGRIAGISGIIQGMLTNAEGGFVWRFAFLIGISSAPFLLQRFAKLDVPFSTTTPALTLAVSGLIVGLGVSLASGCTSGHGICGNSRLSVRSFVATLTFMLSAGATVFIVRHVLGGAP